MPVKSHYTQLHTKCAEVLTESFAGPRAADMAKSHAFIADLALWIGEMGSRPEAPVLQAALREYQFSLLALSFGQYRAAFSALRLSLELCFAAIQWSANERELREWKRGQLTATGDRLSTPTTAFCPSSCTTVLRGTR